MLEAGALAVRGVCCNAGCLPGALGLWVCVLLLWLCCCSCWRHALLLRGRCWPYALTGPRPGVERQLSKLTRHAATDQGQ